MSNFTQIKGLHLQKMAYPGLSSPTIAKLVISELPASTARKKARTSQLTTSSLQLAQLQLALLHTVSQPAMQVSSSSSASLAMRRSASSEWRDWEESLDALSSGADLGGFDHLLLGSADAFLEPFADVSQAPSPVFASRGDFYFEREHDLSLLEAAGVDTTFPFVDSSSALLQQQHLHQQQEEAVGRQRKRKSAELQRLRTEADRLASENAQLGKKIKMAELGRVSTPVKRELSAMREEMAANEQAERLYRRRFDILQGIHEAWNTGVIEDMEEIADTVYDDDVTLISPDYAEGLRGVQAVMAHWNTLLDVFPDGIMEEYEISREESDGDKLKATWVFSGTQICPIHGVEPRHEKVKISGTTFYTFKGDKIRQSVITWNYRETLLKLMGVQPGKTNNVVLSAQVMPKA